MTTPKKINTGKERDVSSYLVKNAEDRNVERQQLNRILLDIQKRLAEMSVSSPAPSPVVTPTPVPSQSSFVQSSSFSSSVQPTPSNQDFTMAFLLGGM